MQIASFKHFLLFELKAHDKNQYFVSRNRSFCTFRLQHLHTFSNLQNVFGFFFFSFIFSFALLAYPQADTLYLQQIQFFLPHSFSKIPYTLQSMAIIVLFACGMMIKYPQLMQMYQEKINKVKSFPELFIWVRPPVAGTSNFSEVGLE